MCEIRLGGRSTALAKAPKWPPLIPLPRRSSQLPPAPPTGTAGCPKGQPHPTKRSHLTPDPSKPKRASPKTPGRRKVSPTHTRTRTRTRKSHISCVQCSVRMKRTPDVLVSSHGGLTGIQLPLLCGFAGLALTLALTLTLTLEIDCSPRNRSIRSSSGPNKGPSGSLLVASLASTRVRVRRTREP